MAEFTEVMTTMSRMCKVDIFCKNCPLSGSAFCSKNTDELERGDFELAEKIIMRWAKEHPVKKRKDKFKEIFGFEPDIHRCPRFSDNCKGCSTQGHITCVRDWWNEEYIEPERVSK